MSAPLSSAPPPIARSFVWYLLIGGAKTLGSYGGFAVLVLGGLHPQIALVATHLLVTVLGYPSHARLAFGVVGWSGFWPYFVIANLIYGANAGLLALGTTLHLDPLLAQALCQLVTIPLGFVLMRRLVRRPAPPGPTHA